MEFTLIEITGAKYGLLVTKKFMFRNLANALHDVMKQAYKDDPDYLKRLKETFKKIHKLNGRRNDLIHAYWQSGPDTKAIVDALRRSQGIATYSKSGTTEREHISIPEMKELADKVAAATVELYGLIQEKKIL